MSRLSRFIQRPLASKVFLGVLAGVYVVYLVAFARFWNPAASTSTGAIIEHDVDTSPAVVAMHWTKASMLTAMNADQQSSPPITQSSSVPSQGPVAKQEGQSPQNGDSSYPLSTVGKIFFSNAAGQNFVCSGTAVVSSNHSVVDSAGHCLYWNGEWVKNLIFCPRYDSGNTPYGCWAARALEVPADWIHANPNDYHHDLGMAIVSANSQGALTDLVGGAGWAYNEPVNQAFSAYGYPAAYPFDGQTLKSCESSTGQTWQHGGGIVVSIPCNMTGGSSGGPWFIKSGGKWYLDGHNDFISSMQPNHMFSPYYDDTWYALYQKAQNT